jgi:hypothetical protein
LVENYVNAYRLLEIQIGNHAGTKGDTSGKAEKSAERDSEYHQF